MTLTDKIIEQAKRCKEEVDASVEVGYQLTPDSFIPMLVAVADYALNQAQLAVAQIEVK